MIQRSTLMRVHMLLAGFILPLAGGCAVLVTAILLS